MNLTSKFLSSLLALSLANMLGAGAAFTTTAYAKATPATAATQAAASAPIKDDTYIIHSADAYNQVLDVMGGSYESGANVALWQNDDVAWQRWTLTANNEGYYSIVNENSHLFLSCESGATAGQPCNVVQATNNGSDGQLWALIDAGNGRYKLQSKLTGLYLDVEGGHAGNSVNVQTWYETSNNGGLGQMFSFTALPSHTIADGTYAIESYDNNLQVLDVMGASYDAGANVALFSNHNSINQKFRVEQLSNGYYMIMAEYTWQALDVVASGTANGTNVTQWPQTRASNQQWIIEDAGDGWYYIISKCSGLYLDVQGGRAGDSVNIQTWEKSDTNDGRGQKFRFARMVDNGNYYIASADDTSKVLDVTGFSLEDGANVTLWSAQITANQIFEVRQLYGRVYKIVSYLSQKALDVVASGTTNGTNVTQWSQHDGKNQEWVAEVQDDGSVMFRSCCSGLYLDVQGGHAGDGVNVQTWEKSNNNGGLGQRFILGRIDAPTRDHVVEQQTHTHTWATRWVQTKAAYDEKVQTKAAWDEQVTVSDGHYENVWVNDHYYFFADGSVYYDDAAAAAHGKELALSGKSGAYKVVDDYEKKWVDTSYTTTKHHDAEYKTVHHDAEGYNQTYCTGCGAIQ